MVWQPVPNHRISGFRWIMLFNKHQPKKISRNGTENIEKNMKINIHNISITILLLIVWVPAQTYFNQLFPVSTELTSTRSLGMGMAGVATSTGYGNIWSNPALLNPGNNLGIVTFSASLERVEEQRSFPVFDMFDDVVADNIYVSNRNWYNNISAGILLNLPLGLRAGLARMTFWDFKYDYLEEVRGSLPSGNYNRDPMAGYHKIHREGHISATSLGLAFSPLSILDLGFGLHLLAGNDLLDRGGIEVYDDNNPDEALAAFADTLYISEMELDGNPMVITGGLAIQPLQRLKIGINYRSAVELKIDGYSRVPVIQERTNLPDYQGLDSTGALAINLPATYSFGLETKLSNPIATRAMVEFHYTDWSDFSIGYDQLVNNETSLPHKYKSTREIRIGVEHVLLNKLPFRFGFTYSESPLGQELELTRITVGGSHDFGPAVLDVAAVFSTVGYRYEDIFPAGGETPSYLESVDESRTTVKVSLNVPF